MNDWFLLDIGNPKESPVAQRMQDIQSQFMASFMLAPACSGRALFWRENHLTGHTEVIFTPQAKDIALMFEGTACPKPEIGQGHIRLLVGDHNLRDYFPGQEQQ